MTFRKLASCSGVVALSLGAMLCQPRPTKGILSLVWRLAGILRGIDSSQALFVVPSEADSWLQK